MCRWIRDRFGSGYETVAGGGSTVGDEGQTRRPPGGTPGILDREGYDQL
jgi:hypothetical protein